MVRSVKYPTFVLAVLCAGCLLVPAQEISSDENNINIAVPRDKDIT